MMIDLTYLSQQLSSLMESQEIQNYMLRVNTHELGCEIIFEMYTNTNSVGFCIDAKELERYHGIEKDFINDRIRRTLQELRRANGLEVDSEAPEVIDTKGTF